MNIHIHPDSKSPLLHTKQYLGGYNNIRVDHKPKSAATAGDKC
jgi:hypothetical protein